MELNNFLGLLVLLCLFSPITGQSSFIPPKVDGFRYGGKMAGEGRVLIEAFLDPVCPDSRDSWQPLKQAYHQYDSNVVELVVYLSPMPYHDNAFVASRALFIANELNSSATFPLLEAIFESQEQFYGSATHNLSSATVIDRIVTFSTKAIGNSNFSAIKSGFNDIETDRATRYSFKFGCVRSIYAVPFFFVNGFPLAGAGTVQNYTVWRDVLDPLVGKQGKN